MLAVTPPLNVELQREALCIHMSCEIEVIFLLKSQKNLSYY